MRYFILLCFFVTQILSFTNTVTANECSGAEKVFQFILKKDWKQLKGKVDWPIRRKAPLKAVNYTSFISNPDVLFDEPVLKALRSNQEISKVGWRGCMTDRGGLWFQEGKKGKLFAINEETEVSRLQRESLTNQMGKKLPEQYQEYIPVIQCKTSLRVYQIYKNSKENYLLSIQGNGKEPFYFDRGTLSFEGSIGFRYFEFKSDAGQAYLGNNAHKGGFDIEFRLGEEKIEEYCSKIGY